MKKTNGFLVFIIITISILIIGLIVLLGLSLTHDRKKPYDKDESTSILVNEGTMNFLDSIVSKNNKPYYNILDLYDKTDEEIFIGLINYLYANNIYTIKDNTYIFKQSDIKKYASMYLMKDEFNYIPINPNIKYESNTFIIKSDYKFLDEEAILFNSIDIYEKTEDKIYVLYDIDGRYVTSNKSINEKYNITIYYNNNNYRIVNIAR